MNFVARSPKDGCGPERPAVETILAQERGVTGLHSNNNRVLLDVDGTTEVRSARAELVDPDDVPLDIVLHHENVSITGARARIHDAHRVPHQIDARWMHVDCSDHVLCSGTKLLVALHLQVLRLEHRCAQYEAKK